MSFDVYFSTAHWLKESELPHHALNLCESTNLLAKSELKGQVKTFVHLANQQTHGRGRGDHQWASPPAGAALLATWTFPLKTAPEHLTAPLVGLGVYRALTATWPDLFWSLKAPNDLYLGDKKVGGLLIEAVSRGDSHTLLIGFGFNVHESPLQVEHASSLRAALEADVSETDYFKFLDLLQSAFQWATETCSIHELSAELREELAAALRKHPLHQDLIGITADGDLLFPDRTIGWYSL